MSPAVLSLDMPVSELTVYAAHVPSSIEQKNWSLCAVKAKAGAPSARIVFESVNLSQNKSPLFAAAFSKESYDVFPD